MIRKSKNKIKINENIYKIYSIIMKNFDEKVNYKNCNVEGRRFSRNLGYTSNFLNSLGQVKNSHSV